MCSCFCYDIYIQRFVQEGLLVVGKDVRAIATMLGFKTKADVVEFYYNWKHQDESYKQWIEHHKLVSTHAQLIALVCVIIDDMCCR
jgi:hypothetical protein